MNGSPIKLSHFKALQPSAVARIGLILDVVSYWNSTFLILFKATNVYRRSGEDYMSVLRLFVVKLEGGRISLLKWMYLHRGLVLGLLKGSPITSP